MSKPRGKCATHGATQREQPAEPFQRWSLRVSPKLHEKVEAARAESGQELGDYVRGALLARLYPHEAPGPYLGWAPIAPACDCYNVSVQIHGSYFRAIANGLEAAGLVEKAESLSPLDALILAAAQFVERNESTPKAWPTKAA